MNKMSAMSRRIRLRRVKNKLNIMTSTIEHKKEMLKYLVNITKAVEDNYNGIPLSTRILNRIQNKELNEYPWTMSKVFTNQHVGGYDAKVVDLFRIAAYMVMKPRYPVCLYLNLINNLLTYISQNPTVAYIDLLDWLDIIHSILYDGYHYYEGCIAESAYELANNENQGWL